MSEVGKGIKQTNKRKILLTHNTTLSVRTKVLNQMLCATHNITTKRKLKIKLKNDPFISTRDWMSSRVLSGVLSLGVCKTKTSKVITMEKIPSLSCSMREFL